jgi:hypothetical protein
MRLADSPRYRVLVEKIRAVPRVPLAGGVVVIAMLVAVIARSERVVRSHIAESGIRSEFSTYITVVEWTIGAVVAMFILTFAMKPVVAGLRRFIRWTGAWPIFAVTAILVSAAVVIFSVLNRTSADPRIARLTANVEWWSAEIAILAVLVVIAWLFVKDLVEGFFQYRSLAAIVGVLAVLFALSALVLIVSTYYLPGWAIAIAAVLIGLTVSWLAAPMMPKFLVGLAFAATIATIPWIADWPGIVGFIVWMMVLALTALRSETPAKYRWFTWVEPIAWIVLLALTARQWQLLKLG